MRVLLVQPRQRRRAGHRAGFRELAIIEPLGLEMVAAVLAAEHQVKLVDLLPGVDLEKTVERFAPEVCGVSCSFTVDVPETLRIVETLRKLRLNAFIFVGGHHASLNPGDFAVPSVHGVVVGEGESSMPEVVRALASGEDLMTVPGLVLNTPRGQVVTSARPLIAGLDRLPLPERSLAYAWRRSYHVGMRGHMSAVETSRGCPYKCTFCSVWRFHQGKVRFKSPERVVEEVEAVTGTNVFVTDDNFLADVPRAEAIADLLMQRGIKKRLMFQARTDAIARHPQTMAKLREAGFATAFLGLEKIDAAGMESVHKHNTVESNETALKVLRKVGINTFGTLIVDPEWGEKDFRRLFDYVRQHAIPNAWFTVLTPLPGTALFEQVHEALTTRDWEIFDLSHAVLPTKLSLERFYKEYAHLYRAVYSPRTVTKKAWNALFNRQGRDLGTFPSPGLFFRSLDLIRCMGDPREYMIGHVQGSESSGG
jgi:hopanoid C-3 methylase